MITPSLIRVLLADDHPIYRDGIKTLVKKIKPVKFEIVGEAGNGKELLMQHLLLQPDVVITDIQMPEMGGIEATTILKKESPETKIIALSTFNDFSSVNEMLNAGADGFLLKNTTKEELGSAIVTVHQGGTYFSSDKGVQEAKHSHLKNNKLKPVLSERERQITELVSQEFSNKEIAHALCLSVRSVETYRERIREKVGAKNFFGVIMYAMKNKWLN